MDIPIKYLKNIKSISTVHLLVSFLERSQGSGKIEYSISDMIRDTSMSRNTVRKSLKELEDESIIIPIEGPSKSKATTYEIVVNNKKGEEWKRATASNQERGKEIERKIDNMDTDYINLFHKDINSKSVVNPNIYMSDKELGRLANKVMKEVFYPVATANKDSRWYAHQMKIMKDLLVEWRTDQVIAGIKYWTEINPPKNGISSLRFLLFKSKGSSNLMQALDYYKQEYIRDSHEEEKREAERIIKEAKVREAERMKKEREEKERVENMSDEEFIGQFLGGIVKNRS